MREVIELEPADLQDLLVSGPAHSVPQLKRVRAIHQTVALRLAMGDRPVEIAAKYAITVQSICRLQHDPQFMEMVGQFQEAQVERALDVSAMIGGVSVEALMALAERLEDPEERKNLSTESIRKIAVDMLDRSGNSPIRRSETNARVSHHLDDSLITQIKARHSENNRFERAKNVTGSAESAGLVASHEEAAERAGATASISELFSTQRETEIIVTTEERDNLSEPSSAGDPS